MKLQEQFNTMFPTGKAAIACTKATLHKTPLFFSISKCKQSFLSPKKNTDISSCQEKK